MLVRVNATTSSKSVPAELTGLVGETSLWHEFKYRRGAEVFGEAETAEYVYQLRAGAVRTYKLLSDGRRQVGGFHLPGDIFGFENGDVHHFTADAIVDTTVWLAKRESVFGGLTEVAAILKLVNRSLEHAENHLLLLGRQTALEKTAAFLLEMDRRLQQPALMILPMSRRDIADYLGLTIETVSRGLSTLRDRGILSLKGQMQRRIVLHDRPKLAEIALSGGCEPRHATRATPRHQNDAELQGRCTHSVPEPHRTRKPVYEHNVPHHHLHVD
jgi:CRP/FNR family transcriptional regulator, nitrogen fixation regulation protein